MSNPTVVLMSGGPDSLITLRWAEAHTELSPVTPLYCDVGNAGGEAEQKSIRDRCQNNADRIQGTDVLKRLGMWEEQDAHIFARNAFLGLVAAKYLPQGGWVLLTVQKDELTLADRSIEFMEAFGPLLTSLVQRPVLVTSPWLHYDKTDMVKWYLEQGYSAEELLMTVSCYRGGRVQCGDCAACIRRFIAFSLNGLEEIYVMDPRKSDAGKVYVDRALKGTYSPDRCQRIKSAYGA